MEWAEGVGEASGRVASRIIKRFLDNINNPRRTHGARTPQELRGLESSGARRGRAGPGGAGRGSALLPWSPGPAGLQLFEARRGSQDSVPGQEEEDEEEGPGVGGCRAGTSKGVAWREPA